MDGTGGTSFWAELILAALATWRVTHLLAKEDGPADAIVRLRAHLGDGLLGRLMDCFQCLSLWIAAGATLLVVRRWPEALLVWLGLSGAACLLERVGQPPVRLQPLTETTEGGLDHELLRSQAGVERGPAAHDGDLTRTTRGG